MAIWGSRSIAAMAIAALASFSVVACGSSPRESPGVSSTSITFGTHQPLSGAGTPGSNEIAPASQAFFDYVNDHGGVFGRKLHLIIKDDASNPPNALDAVRQLVLQDRVFGIYEGQGTRTHAAVVAFLAAQKVPDVFVASGCPCWDSPPDNPQTFGWQPNYTIEGKILGGYIRRHFPRQKVAVLYQNDDFGQGGLAGVKDEVPLVDIVSTQPYQSGATTLAPQLGAIKFSGATVLVEFTAPKYTAIAQLASAGLQYKPRLVISRAGIESTTSGALTRTSSGGKASAAAMTEGAITDDYLPPSGDGSNPWIRLFKRIHDRYDPSAPFDGNVVYGMASAYTLVQALEAAGKSLTRDALVKAIESAGARWSGPGLVPFRYSSTDHGGYAGAKLGQVLGGKIVLFGTPVITDPSGGSPLTPYKRPQPPPPASGTPR